jgi:uncharacterized membrane protein
VTDLPPPGWYPDPSGTPRWWDGQQWTVVAPPGGLQPAALSYGSAPARLDAGAAFSYSWRKFCDHWGVFVPMMLIVAIIALAGTVIAFLTLIPVMSGSSDSTSLALSWTAYLLTIVVVTFITYVLQAGLLRAALAITRGEEPRMAMLVERTHMGTFVGTVLLVSVAFLVGYLLCILPGLIVLLFCAYAPFIALDRGVGPIDAIRRSIELVRARFGEVLVVMLLAGAVYYVGSLACYVGLLVSTPVSILMIAVSYRALEGEPVAP